MSRHTGRESHDGGNVPPDDSSIVRVVGSPAPAATRQRGQASRETPAARFRRLAERRAAKVIRELGRLGNLARGKQYSHTPEQREYLLGAIEKAYLAMRRAFEGGDRQPSLFQLPQ